MPQTGRKYLQDIFVEGQLPKIYQKTKQKTNPKQNKNSSKQTNKKSYNLIRKQTTWLNNGPKTLIDISPKKICTWQISIWKDTSHYM